jgi:hypothetical protein
LPCLAKPRPARPGRAGPCLVKPGEAPGTPSYSGWHLALLEPAHTPAFEGSSRAGRRQHHHARPSFGVEDDPNLLKRVPVRSPLNKMRQCDLRCDDQRLWSRYINSSVVDLDEPPLRSFNLVLTRGYKFGVHYCSFPLKHWRLGLAHAAPGSKGQPLILARIFRALREAVCGSVQALLAELPMEPMQCRAARGLALDAK